MRLFYKIIRKLLPLGVNSILTKILFKFSTKPFVKKDEIKPANKFPNGQKGGVIISADFELGWAWRYARKYKSPLKKSSEMAELARSNFPILLKLFEDYNIPITWATVGHLFLKECKNGDHDWMHCIPYFENKNWRYYSGDWYDCDPASDYKKDPHWYAPDLIKSIIGSKVNHEIGCHTFSHIDFSDKNCLPVVADDEIKACLNASKSFNLDLKSMVFPGGTFGNIPILKKYGFKIYRKNVKYDLAYPYKDEYGLIITPTSVSFGKYHNWSAKYYISRYKRYIDKAINTGTIAHFWFHPSLDRWTIDKVLPSVFGYLKEKRDTNILWIGTMREIANHINNLNLYQKK